MRILKTVPISPLLILCLLSFISFSSTLSADDNTTQSDDLKPVEVVADQLDAAEKEGTSVYRGSVVITQGTTVITGDKITIQHPNSKLSEAVALGNPATFKRFSFEQQKWLTAKAQEITYNAQDKTLKFVGDARVEQAGENSIQGPEIFYDLTQKTLSAKGSGELNQRIKVIFTPEPEKPNNDTNTSTQGKP